MEYFFNHWGPPSLFEEAPKPSKPVSDDDWVEIRIGGSLGNVDEEEDLVLAAEQAYKNGVRLNVKWPESLIASMHGLKYGEILRMRDHFMQPGGSGTPVRPCSPGGTPDLDWPKPDSSPGPESAEHQKKPRKHPYHVITRSKARSEGLKL